MTEENIAVGVLQTGFTNLFKSVLQTGFTNLYKSFSADLCLHVLVPFYSVQRDGRIDNNTDVR